MKKAGRDWGRSRPKFPPAKLAKAMQLRADGNSLAEVSKVTGLSPSYISRLSTRFISWGKGRSSAGTKATALKLLKQRLARLTKEAAEIRSQIKQLTSEPVPKGPEVAVDPESGEVADEQ